MLRKLVIEASKSYADNSADISVELSMQKNVSAVNIISIGEDKREEIIRITIKGNGFNFSDIESILRKYKIEISNIVLVTAGKEDLEPELLFLEEEVEEE